MLRISFEQLTVDDDDSDDDDDDDYDNDNNDDNSNDDGSGLHTKNTEWNCRAQIQISSCSPLLMMEMCIIREVERLAANYMKLKPPNSIVNVSPNWLEQLLGMKFR